MTALISVENLAVELPAGRKIVRVLQGVSFSMQAGEIMGLVGEPGAGKSVTALSILQLLPGGRKVIRDGRIVFKGEDLTVKTPREMRGIRGKEISIIFQEPMTSLNPVCTIGKQVTDMILAHSKVSDEEARDRTLDLFKQVRIADPAMVCGCYPHELSSGLRQRVQIAGALSCRPDLLIADDPAAALDATIQARILKVIKEASDIMGTAVLFISHDLGVVAQLCTRVAVMYAGEIVETGTTAEVLESPLHPYTKVLMAAVPAGSRDGKILPAVPGAVRNGAGLPGGCRFNPYCHAKTRRCEDAKPPLLILEGGRQVACWQQYRSAAYHERQLA